jgi:hypothetical protein
MSTSTSTLQANDILIAGENEGFSEACAGLVTELYKISVETFKIVSNSIHTAASLDRSKVVKEDELRSAQNEVGRLQIWGDGFEADAGGLEQLLEGMEEMQETVATLLAGIARRLSRRTYICKKLPSLGWLLTLGNRHRGAIGFERGLQKIVSVN